LLVIDNYDSFTFNLVQYLGEVGARCVVRRNDQITLDGIVELNPEAIVISPGPCTPNEAGISVECVRRFAGRYPILGVCLGHQAIGQAFGGRVVRAPYPVHGKTSEICHDGRGLYRGLPRPFRAARYHSLVVEEESLPGELAVSARNAEGLVMGLRHRRYLVEGVQFHPESILTPLGKHILANFLALARETNGGRGWVACNT
jgi:anthranilate synthase/aminodeoxychorismate synthase-like glutamine amidotransferase